VLDPVVDGKRLSATEQTAKIGNSVPIHVVEAIVRANTPDRSEAAA
jgi:site-specific DNA-cytosine methylase